MKKNNLLLLLLFTIFTSGFCQEKQKINWEVGDFKQISSQVHLKTIEKGIITSDTIITFRDQLSVLEDNDKTYKIHYTTSNQLLNLANQFYPNINDKFLTDSIFSFNLMVNKNTLSVENLDRAELNKAIDVSYEKIMKVLKSNAIKNSPTAKNKLSELHSALKKDSDENSLINMILEMYKIEYSKTDTIKLMDSVNNPLDSKMFISAKVKTYLNKKSRRINTITVEKEYIFDHTKDSKTSLADMPSEMMTTITGNGDGLEKLGQMSGMLMALMNSYKIKGKDLFIITKNSKSNWPLKLQQKSDVKLSIAGRETNVLIEINTEIK